MRHDLLFMNERGIDKLFAQWRASHAIFSSIEMVSTGYDVVRASDDTYLVVVTAMLHLRLSRYSLQCLCPHVLQNEWLVQRLVGQVLSMPIVNTFHFQPDGSISRMDTAASIIPALLALVGAENALLIVDGAQIQANGELTIPR
ncbi:hypothetical protein SDRG_10375 [Saprolegnia diclina VS20]|uniref:Uncharacterized protein n=1 Tax=Saprolegnia diclina (strain VS20) TaxID=1156394 RepID=T0RQ66_SAPDV|nr:hypothetical protein SDRG_10375 [Saprolegnia diclina VS20]EQC32182.1 hypothetical protein SDRG_10375 [Saprolegnia diclina VS20]|eukprot:XP_008614584.1 hypothetical protein SDRG_10375 [Saprolegnia diclina VS20]